MRARQALTESRRDDFHVLVRAWRAKLDAMYRSDLPDADKRVRKAELYAGMRADYEAMKRDKWGGYNGYDHWFATRQQRGDGRAGAPTTTRSARSSACSRREGSDFDRFYAEVRRMAALPQAGARRRDGAVSRGAAAGACRSRPQHRRQAPIVSG